MRGDYEVGGFEKGNEARSIQVKDQYSVAPPYKCAAKTVGASSAQFFIFGHCHSSGT